jgi:hypothetical protein
LLPFIYFFRSLAPFGSKTELERSKKLNDAWCKGNKQVKIALEKGWNHCGCVNELHDPAAASSIISADRTERTERKKMRRTDGPSYIKTGEPHSSILY